RRHTRSSRDWSSDVCSSDLRYPESLQRLVDDRYLRALPVDPVTGRSDTWILVTANAEQGSGIVDVRSGAPGSNVGGVPYRDLERSEEGRVGEGCGARGAPGR